MRNKFVDYIDTSKFLSKYSISSSPKTKKYFCHKKSKTSLINIHPNPFNLTTSHITHNNSNLNKQYQSFITKNSRNTLIRKILKHKERWSNSEVKHKNMATKIGIEQQSNTLNNIQKLIIPFGLYLPDFHDEENILKPILYTPQ